MRKGPEILEFLKSCQGLEGCWEYPGPRQHRGYCRYSKMINGKQFKGMAHKEAFLASGASLPPGKLVLHKCGNPACVRPDHLYAGTHQDNIDDARRMRRLAWGEKNGAAKLTKEQVEVIRQDKRGHRKIAIDYGVSPTTILCILRGKSWKHLLVKSGDDLIGKYGVKERLR